MSKIRKGDEVIVITGKDKGKRGVVSQWLNEQQLLIAGINRVKKHVKPNPMKGETGGIIEKEMPIQISNVALFNPVSQKADRVGYKLQDDGRKVRVFKSNGAVVGA